MTKRAKSKTITILGVQIKVRHPKRLEKIIDFFYAHPKGEYTAAQISGETNLSIGDVSTYCITLRSTDFLTSRKASVKAVRSSPLTNFWSKKWDDINDNSK